MAEPKDDKGTEASAGETAQSDTTETRYMTAEEFNKASTAREKRLREALMKDFSELLKSRNDAPTPQASHDEDEDDDTPQVKGKAATAELTAKKALARMKEMEKRAKEQEESSKKEREALMAKEERTATLAALSAAGVASTKAALATLREDQRVRRNAEGELVFVASRKLGSEEYEEELPLEVGIKEWLDTSDGKIFQPPRNLEGSGATTPKKTRRAAEMSKEERKIAAGQALLNWAIKSNQ